MLARQDQAVQWVAKVFGRHIRTCRHPQLDGRLCSAHSREVVGDWRAQKLLSRSQRTFWHIDAVPLIPRNPNTPQRWTDRSPTFHPLLLLTVFCNRGGIDVNSTLHRMSTSQRARSMVIMNRCRFLLFRQNRGLERRWGHRLHGSLLQLVFSRRRREFEHLWLHHAYYTTTMAAVRVVVTSIIASQDVHLERQVRFV